MNLGWKVLIPVALAWIMVVATVRALRNEGYEGRWIVLVVGGAVVALALLVVLYRRLRARRAGVAAPDTGTPFDPLAGGFPVPPLPGQDPRPDRPLVRTGHPGREDFDA